MKKKKLFYLLVSLFTLAGIIGFIYEELFYRIDLGYFVKRGSTFGPWIPIYAFGSILIYITTEKIKNNKTLIFITSLLVTGILEYLTGYILFKYFNMRLWDYNKEMLNFLNINGFICLRSVLLFGIAGLIIRVKIVPLLNKLLKKKVYRKTSLILFLLFISDIIIYFIIKRLI